MKILVGIILVFIVAIVIDVTYFASSKWKESHKEVREDTLSQEDIEKTEPISIGKPMELLNLPDKINSWNLVKEDWRWFFTNERIRRPLIFNGHDVRFTMLSPDHKKLGFFYHPDSGLSETVLAVFDIEKKVVKEMYRGDTKVSSWEWKGDEAVIVKRSCGNECMSANVVDIGTGLIAEKYRVY